MKPQTGAFLDQSCELLDQAGTMLEVGLTDAAGRTAYLAGLHAAQALIFERSGRIIRRRRGARNELWRLTKDGPRFDRALQAFLGRGYSLKEIADYETAPARTYRTSWPVPQSRRRGGSSMSSPGLSHSLDRYEAENARP